MATAWTAATEPLDFPIVDLHVHLDNSSIEQVLPLARERHVRFGIVEHAGTKENQYPVVLSTDEELSAYLKRLEGKGVYRGVQAEWTDWMSCFSPEVLARLDYVLTDAMTFPGPSGRRVKLWEPAAQGLVDMSNHERLHGPLRGLARRDHGHRAVRHPGQCLLASRPVDPRSTRRSGPSGASRRCWTRRSSSASRSRSAPATSSPSWVF